MTNAFARGETCPIILVASLHQRGRDRVVRLSLLGVPAGGVVSSPHQTRRGSRHGRDSLHQRGRDRVARPSLHDMPCTAPCIHAAEIASTPKHTRHAARRKVDRGSHGSEVRLTGVIWMILH
jgi:hypothetical protein